MTRTQATSICPLCLNDYKALSQHLKRAHFVLNIDERRLLLNLASRRVNIRSGPCPVSGCKYHSSRLDKHLQDGHPEMSPSHMFNEQQAARRAVTVELLGHLRATNPQVAMVSSLDVDQRDPEEPQGVDEVDPGAVCLRPDCMTERAELLVATATIERKERESLVLLKQVTVQARQLCLYQKVVREVSAAGSEVNSITLAT